MRRQSLASFLTVSVAHQELVLVLRKIGILVDTFTLACILCFLCTHIIIVILSGKLPVLQSHSVR